MDTSTPIKRNSAAILPLFSVLTGLSAPLSELADPYATVLPEFVLISGTGKYRLKFTSLEEVRQGGPYQVEWNQFHLSDGTPAEGGWDIKPVFWSAPPQMKLWNPTDKAPATVVWYGGYMRSPAINQTARWPQDNYSRDVFAFLQKEPGKWLAMEDSIFSVRANWPRARGNYLGHRYGHQIVMIPKIEGDKRSYTPAIFYEEVTEIKKNGAPLITKIFMDEMASPFEVKGKPIELISPINPKTGKYFPSAVREDGAALVEGPLYFRFQFEGEEWEAIGFSAGSYYSHYPSCFASRRIEDGLKGKSYQIHLTKNGSDLHNAAAEFGKPLNMTGGPGRPAVIVGQDGNAIPGPDGSLQVLVHGYPSGQKSRVLLYTYLKIEKENSGSLAFTLMPRPILAKQVADENIAATVDPAF